MLSVYLGIDPGLDGGLVFLDGDCRVLETHVMPRVENLLDLPRIRKLFSTKVVDHAFLESVSAMPKQGSVSVFKFGRVFGLVEGLLVGLQVPYTLVRPATWQKQMHQGVERKIDPKKRSLIAIGRMYPGLDLRRSQRAKISHSGKVDAILIARWGVRFGGVV